MDAVRLAEIMDRHAAALQLYARQWCRCADDVVQETFLKLSEQSREPAEVAPWLFRVARNGAISAGRAERRRAFHEQQASRPSAWFAEDASTPIDAQTATEALGRLSLDDREIIIARLWGGLTFEQIAPLAGVSAATAYRRYAAGLEALRVCLEAPCRDTT